MDHLKPFRARRTVSLEPASDRGWQLKRYAIIAGGRKFDAAVAAAATAEVLRRLPDAGPLENAAGNHGIGFQIIHFAEVAVVSPVFYWQWGSVLAQLGQIRARWDAPHEFQDGIAEVVGCVWEMDVVQFETEAWTRSMLSASADPEDRLSDYLNRYAKPAS